MNHQLDDISLALLCLALAPLTLRVCRLLMLIALLMWLAFTGQL